MMSSWASFPKEHRAKKLKMSSPCHLWQHWKRCGENGYEQFHRGRLSKLVTFFPVPSINHLWQGMLALFGDCDLSTQSGDWNPAVPKMTSKHPDCSFHMCMIEKSLCYSISQAFRDSVSWLGERDRWHWFVVSSTWTAGSITFYQMAPPCERDGVQDSA